MENQASEADPISARDPDAIRRFLVAERFSATRMSCVDAARICPG
jgi:hypothetical protein